MPLPKTADVGKIMGELKEGRKRPYIQRIAIALSHARKMGADIPQKARKHVVNKLRKKASKK